VATVPLPANCVLNAQMFGHLNGQAIITLFQYRFDGTPSSLDYTAYLDDFAQSWADVVTGIEPLLRSVFPDNYEYDFLRLQVVYPQRLRFMEYSKAVTGNSGNDASTSNLAVSIERWSKINKRRGIGRIQIPLGDNEYVDGIVNNVPYKNALALVKTRMTEPILTGGTGTSGTWNPVIANTAAPQIVISPVDGATIKTTVRVMRRRTVGLGI